MADMSARAVTGLIFEMQRFSVHDGPGIRTTVFMKGCPLACIWCHNPEGMSQEMDLSFVENKCIGCGYCFRACPRGAHRLEEERHVLDRDVCDACGTCAEKCYARALEVVGREVSVGEVLEHVLRDKPFYETSGGGLTLSGGEPTYQIDFAEAVLRAAKEEGLHCCVQTCGYAEPECFERLRPHVDLFLYDIKETDAERHRACTGAGLDRILHNLRALHDAGAAIRLRCPVIPGYNDRPDHFEALAALARELPRIAGIELMPYNRLGESKVNRCGLDAMSRAHSAPPDKNHLARWIARLRGHGAPVVGQR